MTNAFKPSESPSVDNIQTVGCRTVVQVRGQELVEEQRWRSVTAALRTNENQISFKWICAFEDRHF